MASLRLFSLVSLLAGTAAAQTGAFTISNVNFAFANGGNLTYTTAITTGAPGTATFSGSISGTASVAASFTGTRERGLNCGSAAQLTLKFSFNSNDTLTAFVSVSSAPALATAPFTITAGTGAYAGRGGSGTLAITVNQTATSISVSGGASGTLTSQAIASATISPSGIVPVYSAVPIIQPGSWISIYGANLANSTTVWNGDFPQTLGGVTVSINGKLGYLWFVSPGQINLQAPDDTAQGCVNVVVNTPNGQVTSAVTLKADQPSFSLVTGTTYLVGEIPTPDGSGAYGSGGNSYDLVGPTGAFSFKTRPVKAGETVVLFGVGFGPTASPVPAGKVYNSATPVTGTVNVLIGGVNAKVAYAGIVGAGLYQLNVVVPASIHGDQLIQATVNNLQSRPILFSSDATQSCMDSDPQGSNPTGCNVYITVQ